MTEEAWQERLGGGTQDPRAQGCGRLGSQGSCSSPRGTSTAHPRPVSPVDEAGHGAARGYTSLTQGQDGMGLPPAHPPNPGPGLTAGQKRQEEILKGQRRPQE